jgi:hypothetical protein
VSGYKKESIVAIESLSLVACFLSSRLLSKQYKKNEATKSKPKKQESSIRMQTDSRKRTKGNKENKEKGKKRI